jgi:hypothetical protein
LSRVVEKSDITVFCAAPNLCPAILKSSVTMVHCE